MPNRIEPERERYLIQHIRDDPRCLEELYEAYLPAVYGYIYSRVNHRQDTEDLTSEVFLKMIRHLDQHRLQHSFAAWLFTIAHHSVIDFYRHAAKSQTVETIPTASVSDPFVEYQDLYQLIAKLPERRQEVITLKFFGGLRNQEIALILKLDERTVASHLSRALEDLYQQLQEG
ncbi:MAG: RNA polymerase sigma factor [Anaerolineae bacterium]|jgi:RNA polymerase sigma-70 factor (ECF subfamily)|nr:RNA polymerase sigma factor [Anaerolineae bacterium]